jgi:hypothetical protein
MGCNEGGMVGALGSRQQEACCASVKNRLDGMKERRATIGARKPRF